MREEEMSNLNAPLRDVLEGRHYATLATHNDDGTILLTPVWYLFDNGNFYVGSLSTSKKVRNLMARNGATIMIDIRTPGTELWVSASGDVEIITGQTSRQINARIFPRYLTKEALDDDQIGPLFAGVNDITICLTPQTWRSWNSRDVDQQFLGGKLATTPEKWFHPMDE